MAKYSNTVEYKLKTTLDSSGFTKLQSEIAKTQDELRRLSGLGGNSSYTKELEKSISTLESLRASLSKSFNTDLGLFDATKFTQSLTKAKTSINEIKTAFAQAGTTGQQAFNSMTAKIASLDTGLKSISTNTQKIFTTFANTARWGVTASIFETMSNSLGRAVEYVQELDKSLNDIQIVSGYSSEYMKEFAQQANEAAQALGQTTTAYTDASLIYIQQGKNLEESAKLAELTLKTANVTGQETAEVSEQLTSLMNGYQIAVDDMEASVDKLAKVAAIGAADMEELATASSKVASTANALGVSQDQLIAQLSTIISVTRQAPENVGNAMKTIYARLGDVSLGETLDDGTTLGSIGETLQAIGVDLLDTTGELRNMGDVIEDLMVKWEDLSTAQQQAVAVELAGKYQYNNLLALLENAEMYNEQLQGSYDSLGTINEQQEIYMDSLEAKLSQLQSSFEGFINAIFDPDDIKPFIEEITSLINLVTDFASSVGGGGTILTGLAGTAMTAFSGPIARGITNVQKNSQRNQIVNEGFDATAELVNLLGIDDASKLAEDSLTYQYAKGMSPYTSSFSEEELTSYRKTLTELAQRENERLQINEKLLQVADSINLAYQAVTGEADKIAKVDNNRVVVNNELLDVLQAVKNQRNEIDQADTTLLNAGSKLTGIASYAKSDSQESDQTRANKLKSQVTSLKKAVEPLQDSTVPMLREFYEEVQLLNTRGLSTGKKSFKEFGNEVDRLVQRLNRLKTATSTALDKMPTEADINAVNAQATMADAAEQGDRDYAGTDIEITKNQRLTQSYIEVAGSITQLAFAWQSFQSLGSIWNNEDLTFGEKLTQTIMNVVPSIAMLVSSIQTLKSATAQIKTLSAEDTTATAQNTAAIETNTKAATKNATAKNASAAANDADTKSKNKNTAAQTADGLTKSSSKSGIGGLLGKLGSSTLTKGLSSLISVAAKAAGPISALLLVGDVITTIVDSVKEAEEEALQAKRDAADLAKENYDSTTSDYESYTSLKEEYDDTGEATDSFKDSLRTLGESFDIQETEALLAAGAYDELAGKVEAARLEAQKEWLTTTSDALAAELEAADSDINSFIDDNNDPFSFKWEDLLTNIGDTIYVIWQNLTSEFTILDTIKEKIIEIVNGITEIITNIVDAPGRFINSLAGLVSGKSAEEVAAEDKNKVLEQQYEAAGIPEDQRIYLDTTDYVKEAENKSLEDYEYSDFLNQARADAVYEAVQEAIDMAGLSDVITAKDLVEAVYGNKTIDLDKNQMLSLNLQLAKKGFGTSDNLLFTKIDTAEGQETTVDNATKMVSQDSDVLGQYTANWMNTLLNSLNPTLSGGMKMILDNLDMFDNPQVLEQYGITYDKDSGTVSYQQGSITALTDTTALYDFIQTIFNSLGGELDITLDDFKDNVAEAMQAESIQEAGESLNENLSEGVSGFVASQELFNEGVNKLNDIAEEEATARAQEKKNAAIEEAQQKNDERDANNAVLAEKDFGDILNEAPTDDDTTINGTEGQEKSQRSKIEDYFYEDDESNYGDWRNFTYRGQFGSAEFLETFASTIGMATDNVEAFGEMADAIAREDKMGIINSFDDIDSALDTMESNIQAVIDDESQTKQTRDKARVALEEIQAYHEDITSLASSYGSIATELKEGISSIAEEFFESGATLIGDSPESFKNQLVEYAKNVLGIDDDSPYLQFFTDSLTDTTEALDLLAEAAYNAGNEEQGNALTRQGYELTYGNSALSDTLYDYSDAEANKLYAALDAQGGLDGEGADVDLDTVNAVIQHVLDSGGTLADAIDLIGSDLVDVTRDFDTYAQELSDVFTNGDYAAWQVDNDYNNYADGFRDLIDAQQNDEVTGEVLEASGLNSDIVDTLNAAAGQSDALADSLALVANNSFEAQRGIIELGDGLNRYDYNNQIEDIEETQNAIATLEDEIDKYNRGSSSLILDADDLEDVQAELEDLYDTLDNQQLELDINMAGDLLDKADATIEAIEDVRSAMDLIGEDYTVDPSSLQELISVFPDILDNATVTSDGLIQLDQQVADASIAASQSEIDAAIAADSGKLQAAINYAGAMAEQYQAEAEGYAALANSTETTAASVAEAKANYSAEEAEIRTKNEEAVGETMMTALDTEMTNSQNAAQTEMDNSKVAADTAISNLGAIGSQSGLVADQVVSNAKVMWAAIQSIGTDTFVGGSGNSSRSSVGTTTGTAIKATLSAVTSGGGEITDGSSIGEMSAAQQEAAELAAAAEAKAELWNNIQAQLQSRLLSMQAGGVSVGNGIGSGSSGSGGSGGSGGGGDGSGSEYDPKVKEYQEDEIDRYEKVETLLDAITADFEKLNAEQERLIGYDYADNLTKQIYLLRQQIDLQKQKLEIQKEEAQEYADELKSSYGIQINDEGFITNYKEVYKATLDTLNSLIAEYNATTTEEGQEALEEQIETAQEVYDNFVDLVDKYDELISSSIKDTEQQIEDLYDNIEDLNIEAFQKAVEAADTIKDLNEALIEFNQAFSGKQSDDPFRAMETSASKLAGYFDVANESADDYYDTLIGRYKELMKAEGVSQSQKNFYQSQIDAINSARQQVGQGTMESFGTGYLDMSMMNVAAIAEQIRQFEETGVSEYFGSDSADLYDTAQTIFEQATDLIADYEDEVDNLRDSILDAIDEIGDRMDERVEQYEAITDALEHQASLIEMIHGDEAYEKLNQVLAAQQYNYRQQIEESKQQLEYWEDLLDAMEEGSDEYTALQEKILDTQSSLNELVETYVDTLQQQYNNSVNNIVDNWIDDLFGVDIDWLAEEWEMINRNADYYLDDVNAAYNIQKLQSKYLEMLDEADSLDIQQKITQQMNEQLTYLREKDKLSEYDVAYAEAQLEILQKQIALQEAQSNKSQMKLRRDSQGNYSYVYTADEGDVASAQGDLLDAQNNAYNLSKDQMSQTQSDTLSAVQDAADLLKNIWLNANLTVEERAERMQEVIDSLKEYMSMTGEQLSTSEKNIINDFIGMVELLSEENREGLNDIYEDIVSGNNDAFDQIDDRWNTALTNMMSNLDKFNSSTDEMFEDLVDNAENYQDDLDDISDLIGEDFDNISDAIQDCVDKTNSLAASNAEFINQLKNDSGVIKEYETTLQSYADKIANAENSMRAYQTQVNELQGQLVSKEQENSNLTGQIQDLYDQINASKNQNNSSSDGGSGDSGNGSGYTDYELANGIAQSIWTYGVSSGWGNDPLRSSKLTGAYGAEFARQVQSIINQKAYSNESDLVNYDSMKFSSYQLLGYNTGGYTGEWSDPSGAGRLALLHSKELVLNEDDTNNILEAVQAVRSMTTELKNESFSKMIDYLSKQGSNALMGSLGSDTIEQEVHITATFPNATTADDIREAILGLNDQIIQYAHRRTN